MILKEYIMEDEVAPMLIYFRNIYYKYFQENQQRERLSCATDKNTLSAFIEHVSESKGILVVLVLYCKHSFFPKLMYKSIFCYSKY